MIVESKLRHFIRQGHTIRGVVHVGTNWGEEIPDYLQFADKVVGFEPLPDVFVELVRRQHVEGRTNFYNIALGNDDTLQSIVEVVGPPPPSWVETGGGGISDSGGSSFLERNEHGLKAKGYRVRHLKVPVRKFTSWTYEHPDIHLGDYDALVIDVQGMELDVLKGFGNLLYGFDYANIECSASPIYQGEAPASEVIAYLKKFGLEARTPIEEHNDILFQR